RGAKALKLAQEVIHTFVVLLDGGHAENHKAIVRYTETHPGGMPVSGTKAVDVDEVRNRECQLTLGPMLFPLIQVAGREVLEEGEAAEEGGWLFGAMREDDPWTR